MTIARIAALAGVSSPTVSKVINGRGDVSLPTRQRVEATIREHGYQRAARAARSSPLLEVIFNELESDWALEIIKGVEQVAKENDLAVVLSEMQGRRATGRCWIDGVLERLRVGVIAVLSDLSDGDRGAPALPQDPPGRDRSHRRAPARRPVHRGSELERRGSAATRHLLGLGHRRPR